MHLEDAIRTAADALTARKEELKILESAVIDLEKEISLSKHSLQGKNEEIERMMRRLSFLETELTTLAGEKDSLHEVIGTKTDEIAGLEEERIRLNDEISILQESLATVRGEYDTERSHLAR